MISLTPVSTQNNKNYSVVDSNKKDLRTIYILCCPLLIGLSTFIALNALIETTNQNNQLDYIGVVETVSVTLVIISIVFLSIFCKNKYEFINSYSFTNIEKNEFRTSIIFVIIFSSIHIIFEIINISFLFVYVSKGECLRYNYGSYFCSDVYYLLIIFIIAIISSIINLVFSIKTINSINKFTETPTEPKQFIKYSIEIEKNKHHHLICMFLPLTFSCIITYFICLATAFSLLSYMTQEAFDFILVISTTCISVVTICNINYIIHKNKIIENYTSEKERKQYLSSFIIQTIFMLIDTALIFYLFAYSYNGGPGGVKDYVYLTVILLASLASLVMVPFGIYFSTKTDSQNQEENYEKKEQEYPKDNTYKYDSPLNNEFEKVPIVYNVPSYTSSLI